MQETRREGQSGIDTSGIVDRIDSLRRTRTDADGEQVRETIAEFCARCDLNATAISKWRGDNRISIYSLVKIAEANNASLDWIVFGYEKESPATRMLDTLASGIVELLNRTYALTNERRTLRLVKRAEPTANGEDTD